MRAIMVSSYKNSNLFEHLFDTAARLMVCLLSPPTFILNKTKISKQFRVVCLSLKFRLFDFRGNPKVADTVFSS